MNIALLQRLRDAAGRFVPLETLGDDPARVVRDLDELAGFGFGLDRHPDLGAAYLGPSPRLCPDQIEWELNTRRIGRRVAVWSRLASTNDAAARASGSRSNEGLVVLAEEQTAGRGRRGRAWSAPAGSAVLLSTLIFPPETLADVGWLTALGAIAAAEVVEAATGRSAGIKWPNDVRVEGRKVAGILVERGRGAVLGIGLNVNAETADLPEPLRASATSLRILNGAALDRSELARALIQRLDHHYGRALAEGPGAAGEPWRSRLEPLGRAVRLATHAGPVAGVLREADLVDGLLIVDDLGRAVRVPNFEVLAFEADETSANSVANLLGPEQTPR